jgi:predicted RecB family nuclease
MGHTWRGVPYNFTAPQGTRKPETPWDEYQSALTEARAILAKRFTPQAAYSAACKLCRWYTFCVEQLTVSDDLTLIPSLGRTVRDKMQAVVPTIAGFAAANRDDFIEGKKSVFPGLGLDRLRLFHSRAVMLKSTPPKPYLRAPVTLRVVPVELFFDVEVDPLRNICYLHGVVERRGGSNETERFVHFFATDLTADAERDAFAQAYTIILLGYPTSKRADYLRPLDRKASSRPSGVSPFARGTRPGDCPGRSRKRS